MSTFFNLFWLLELCAWACYLHHCIPSLSLPAPLISPQFPPKFTTSSLIFIIIQTHKYTTHMPLKTKEWQQTPNDPNELFSRACMYTCSQLVNWDLTTYVWPCPWIRVTIPLSSYLTQNRAFWNFPCPYCHTNGAVIPHVLFRQPNHWDFMETVSLSCLDDST